MNTKHFSDILKQVSRSFYLSIRVLPYPMRKPVGIAYLLARAADSMTDSDQIERQVRLQYLQQFLIFLSQNLTIESKKFCDLLTPLLSDIGEKKLIHNLPDILASFHQLPEEDKNRVKTVVQTLIEGMQRDLNIFTQPEKIIALKNSQALEEYTYLVAGCVGEFWTKIAIAHLSSVKKWDEKRQIERGIAFGKALQLTNILRDIAKDARLGRCYLPETTLTFYQLTTEQLLDKKNDRLFRPVINSELSRALSYYESAEQYLTSTPRCAIRLRLASIWPILIGLKTLGLIANKENFLDSNKNIKVQRKWVYGMLFQSLCIVGSNRLLSFWIRQLKENIRKKT